MTFYRWMYLLYPFTILNTLVSLLILGPLYGVKKWRWSNGCLELVAKRKMLGDPAGQSLGCPVIWYASEEYMDNWQLRVHERVHVVQGLYGLGVFFALAYVSHFLVLYAKHRDWYIAYRDIWAEEQAYKVQAEYARGFRPNAWGGSREYLQS